MQIELIVIYSRLEHTCILVEEIVYVNNEFHLIM